MIHIIPEREKIGDVQYLEIRIRTAKGLQTTLDTAKVHIKYTLYNIFAILIPLHSLHSPLSTGDIHVTSAFLAQCCKFSVLTLDIQSYWVQLRVR